MLHAVDVVKAIEVALEYLTEQEQQRAEGLVLCRCCDSVLDRQPAQEARHVSRIRLPRSQLAGEPAEEAHDPANVSLFGTAAVVARAQYFSQVGDELQLLRSQLRLCGLLRLARRRRRGAFSCALRCAPVALCRRRMAAPPSTPPVRRRGERLERSPLGASTNHPHPVPPDRVLSVELRLRFRGGFRRNAAIPTLAGERADWVQAEGRAAGDLR